MTTKSRALAKAATLGPVHMTGNHSASESHIINTAETYAPTDAADWTGLGLTAPTAQDEALDSLAANALAQSAQLSGGTWVTAEWDVSVDGGAVSTIGLDVTIPDEAIITYGFVKVDVATVSATGTIQFNVPVDGNLTAAITVADTAAAFLPGTQTWTPSTFVETTAAMATI